MKLSSTKKQATVGRKMSDLQDYKLSINHQKLLVGGANPWLDDE